VAGVRRLVPRVRFVSEVGDSLSVRCRPGHFSSHCPRHRSSRCFHVALARSCPKFGSSNPGMSQKKAKNQLEHDPVAVFLCLQPEGTLQRSAHQFTNRHACLSAFLSIQHISARSTLFYFKKEACVGAMWTHTTSYSELTLPMWTHIFCRDGELFEFCVWTQSTCCVNSHLKFWLLTYMLLHAPLVHSSDEHEAYSVGRSRRTVSTKSIRYYEQGGGTILT
jgi:hypothetical protein